MRERVCVLSDSPYFYPPFTAGGSVGQLLQITKSLRRGGADAFIVAREPTDPWDPKTATPEDPPITYVGPAGEQRGKGWGALLPNLLYVLHAFGFLIANRKRFDIVLVSGFRLLAVPASLAARLMGRPCIVRLEDANDLTFTLTKESSERMGKVGRGIMLAIVRTLYWSAFRLSHRLIAFSPDIASRLIEMGAPPRKVQVIPNGLDVGTFEPASAEARRALRERLDLPADKTVFVYTGRLTRSKGVMDLIQAWTELASERNDVLLLMLGIEGGGPDGCEADARSTLASRGVASSVLFRGSVRNVADYLKASDIFVFLSHGEMLSLSVLEALAVGLPSLLTTVGAVKYLRRTPKWGYVVEPRSPSSDVAARLRMLLSERNEWPAMGQAGRALATAGYSIDSVTEQYRSLFQQLGKSTG